MSERRARLLMVDDDPDLLRLLGLRLEKAGYAVDAAASAREALAQAEANRPDLVLTDLRMEGRDGIDLLEALKREMPGLPVIIITAHGTIPDAVRATHSGAFSFVTKPIDHEVLLEQIQGALGTYGTGHAGGRTPVEIVTRSPEMEALLERARRVADSEASVLIEGQSGSGKEVLARFLHASSPRARAELVAVNCGAMPEGLLESELFGHEKGAFTGADRRRDGLLRHADRGTLFLDEIGDMPATLQVKLLRVLQDGRVRAVGASEEHPVDLRVISATHRDLASEIEAGRFREDLYYRLNVVTLRVPALEERREDIPLLATHFLERLCERQGRTHSFAPEAIDVLVQAEWPGNVRQLANVVERTFTLASAPVITAEEVADAVGHAATAVPSFDEARAEFSRRYLARLLTLTGGNVSRAARLAQRNRTDFYKLLARHGIDPEQFKS